MMSYFSRLYKTYEGALRLPLDYHSKYVLFSDCHRGVGNSNDNFLKNQTLYLAALQHYFHAGYTYIELGDGDELWENRSMKPIVDAHTSVFQLLARFYDQNRLYLLYGNHDIIKRNKAFDFHEGIVLESPVSQGVRNIYLTHGHQVDFLNSVLWPLSRFLTRYVWKPLEALGISDPTSTAKNYHKREKNEAFLHSFAMQEDLMLIAGHTHRPYLSETDPYYCNTGSCIHPYSITCLEIEHMQISLVKWILSAKSDMSLYVSREVLSGPVPLTHMHLTL